MRYVIIAQTGDSRLLVVDTQTQTVEVLDAATAVPAAIRDLRAEGGAIYRGVDIAIAADQREDGSNRWFFTE